MTYSSQRLRGRKVRNEYLTFGAPEILQPEIDEVVDTLRSGWIGSGPKVAQFEHDFAEYKRSDHAVALNSCTASLLLSMIAAGIGPGAEVITTPMTFCATINAILHAGATPVLAEIDPKTFNIDPDEIELKIGPRTRALLVVHFAGRPCDMSRIMQIVERHNLILIEDCAHALESRYNNKETGTFGLFGCFSFYVTKNVVTGEGGMVIARNAEDASRIKKLALHGMSDDAWKRYTDSGFKHYYVVEAGYKFNMTDLQASIGIHQLQRVETNWVTRENIRRRYQAELHDLPLTMPPDPEVGTRHANHLYPVLINEDSGVTRDDFVSILHNSNIGTGIHYLSIPEHPFYQKAFGWSPDDYPIAQRVGRQIVSLPLSAALCEQDVDDVIEATKLAF